MRRVLGHSTAWREEKGVPPIKIGSISPGGVVTIHIPTGLDPAAVDLPDRVIAVYMPREEGTARATRSTPDSILGSGGFSAKVDVPKDGGDVTAVVPGVKPGNWTVQLIYEWDDDKPASTTPRVVAQGEHTKPPGP